MVVAVWGWLSMFNAIKADGRSSMGVTEHV